MERASERAKEVCAVSLAHSKELKELLTKETLAAKCEEEAITKSCEFDNSKRASSEATYVISEARKIIENVRGPLQEERVQFGPSKAWHFSSTLINLAAPHPSAAPHRVINLINSVAPHRVMKFSHGCISAIGSAQPQQPQTSLVKLARTLCCTFEH